MQLVEVKTIDKDRYGRIVALVFIEGDGECLNEELVRSSHTWVYDKYCHLRDCNYLGKLEKQAMSSGKGLWLGRTQYRLGIGDIEAGAAHPQRVPAGQAETRTAAISIHMQRLRDFLRLTSQVIYIGWMGIGWRVSSCHDQEGLADLCCKNA